MATYHRRVIKIQAIHSPNVALALMEIAAGLEPSHTEVVPGVLSYQEYTRRRATWDVIRQCIGLDASWWAGRELLLFPPVWLDHAERLARERRSPTYPRWMGVDPAEGGDKSAWSVVDRHGLIFQTSLPTPDTTVVTGTTLALMREWGVPDENVAFDRGGGGKEHADRLRLQGHKGIRTIAFGESLVLYPKRGLRQLAEKLEQKEDRYVYINRRSEMYWELAQLIDPDSELGGFALPAEYAELRRQLAPMPRLYDPEGRCRMLPKNKRSPDSTEKTLTELIGHSPDEADSCVLAVHAMLHKAKVATAGAVR